MSLNAWRTMIYYFAFMAAMGLVMAVLWWTW